MAASIHGQLHAHGSGSTDAGIKLTSIMMQYIDMSIDGTISTQLKSTSIQGVATAAAAATTAGWSQPIESVPLLSWAAGELSTWRVLMQLVVERFQLRHCTDHPRFATFLQRCCNCRVNGGFTTHQRVELGNSGWGVVQRALVVQRGQQHGQILLGWARTFRTDLGSTTPYLFSYAFQR
jgi:hypothetical protein